jgi:hypothetical protein
MATKLLARWEVFYFDPTKDDRPLCKRTVIATTKGQARNAVREDFPGYIVAFLDVRALGYVQRRTK